MKTQAQITDLESKLKDLQASLWSTLESHLKSQSSIMSEQHKLLIEFIERQKVENEELRKALAETNQKKDDEIKERDCQIKKKEQQIQELREELHLTTNRQNGEERGVSPEIAKQNKLEKGFLFFL